MRGAYKFGYRYINVIQTIKPNWLRVRIPNISDNIIGIKKILRKHKLNTVCEEASCPNLSECFNNRTLTFMIMGAICTRRCSFCDVAHGRPDTPNVNESIELAKAISEMHLNYVVITSVNRDDLQYCGANKFIECIIEIRKLSQNIKIEILVPDFRGCMDTAIKILCKEPPNVFNHNIETVPILYRKVRPGANYQCSLNLLKRYKQLNPLRITKSGLMVGIGETNQQIIDVMNDLRTHGVDMLTIGQYLQPSRYHIPIARWVNPTTFNFFEKEGYAMGFTHVASGPLVRSSYHADKQVYSVN
ncbi:Lipoyl synthase [Candidatus Johnevansia muelleri]|uniref:Lipoyl synthase n=1 Tax=Candidatus Johnevansia muelleri TaxID=1495769 RepID=A0A078KDY0_9GAMM|nr:Lipoyl synthase [Candidatus Evansia muelleri]